MIQPLVREAVSKTATSYLPMKVKTAAPRAKIAASTPKKVILDRKYARP